MLEHQFKKKNDDFFCQLCILYECHVRKAYDLGALRRALGGMGLLAGQRWSVIMTAVIKGGHMSYMAVLMVPDIIHSHTT